MNKYKINLQQLIYVNNIITIETDKNLEEINKILNKIDNLNLPNSDIYVEKLRKISEIEASSKTQKWGSTKAIEIKSNLKELEED